MTEVAKLLPQVAEIAEIEFITKKTNFFGGKGYQIKFKNGYGASIVENTISYGIELAVFKYKDSTDKVGSLCYDTHITNNVIGHLDAEALCHILCNIRDLPSAYDKKNDIYKKIGLN